jgi:hypothetical protein
MRSSHRHAEWLPRALLLVALLVPRAVFASDTDEDILDGPFEAVGARDEVFSPPGITGDWGGAG